MHTDLFPIGEDRVNAIYGYERTRLNGTADFDVYDDLTVGVGGEWRTLDRTGSAVEVSSEEVLDGYGRVQFRPSGYLGFVVKGGVEEREPDNYDVDVAAQSARTRSCASSTMAYRYRSYGELLANVAVGIAAAVARRQCALRRRQLHAVRVSACVSGLDRRYGVDLNWTVNEKISAYATAGREKIDSRPKGSSMFAAADWTGDVQDDFETYGAGMNAQFTDKIGVTSTTRMARVTRARVISGSAGELPRGQERAQFVQGRSHLRLQRPHGRDAELVVRDAQHQRLGVHVAARLRCRRCSGSASIPTTTTSTT